MQGGLHGRVTGPSLRARAKKGPGLVSQFALTLLKSLITCTQGTPHFRF